MTFAHVLMLEHAQQRTFEPLNLQLSLRYSIERLISVLQRNWFYATIVMSMYQKEHTTNINAYISTLNQGNGAKKECLMLLGNFYH